ncbi:MAG: AAA family ATPase [Proteobacteria bacterium]|nr:AAA family ATPase [Pseudomonadota bacterium]
MNTKLIGFDSTKSNLLASYQNNKLPHAILILGKKGIGKATFARDFAMQITKSNSDILVVEKEAEKREIGVEKIRNIKDFVNQTSAFSEDKFIIIDSACELTRSAANSLLKILEEPRPNNFIVLVAHNLHRVLPTIRSRCRIVRISDLSHEDFVKIVKNDADFLAEICDNSPATALSLGADLSRFYALFLRSILNQKISEELLKKVADKNYSSQITEKSCEFFFSRLMKFFCGVEPKFFFEEEKVFLTLKQKLSAEKIFKICDESLLLLNKTQSLHLDKKLTLINIFNHFVND